MTDQYIHSYTDQERQRLWRQGLYLNPIVLDPLSFLPSRHLLDFGCGIGAQIHKLANAHPDLKITGIDRNQSQLDEARKRLEPFLATGQVDLICANSLDDLSLETVDTVLVTWVLEHVTSPLSVLQNLKAKLSPGVRVICTEVFNASLFLDPQKPGFKPYLDAFNRLQTEFGCDVNIGIKLTSLFCEAGFNAIESRPIHPCIDKTLVGDARERAIDYWRDLYLSARVELENRQYVTSSESEDLVASFEALRRNDDGIYSYFAIQCQGLT